MSFELHPNLRGKIKVCELALCSVLLEDDQHYPWLMLVPKRAHVSKIMDLSASDQLQLLKELDLCQKALWDTFQPKQINVAAIGNKTPQLHVHVIARFEDDPAWPQTVWDHPIRAPYSEEKKREVLQALKALLHVED